MVKALTEEESAEQNSLSNVDTGTNFGATAVEKQKESSFVRELENEFNNGRAAEEAEPVVTRTRRSKRNPAT